MAVRKLGLGFCPASPSIFCEVNYLLPECHSKLCGVFGIPQNSISFH